MRLALRTRFDYHRMMAADPDISAIAALVGEPARASMLTALLTGRALTASELAVEAGVTAQTASSHLGKLTGGGLIVEEQQGRHRYFRLADRQVAVTLESLLGLAAKLGHVRIRVGPADPALRRARICYDHLAGELGVSLFDALLEQGMLQKAPDAVSLTEQGVVKLQGLGIEITPLARSRRPLCRTCLDWSARRPHLAGSLGAAIFTRILDRGWAKQLPHSRVVEFVPAGERKFRAEFQITA